MKCAVHADVDATGYCRNCGKALCPQCTREVKGALYCEDCLATLVTTPTGTSGGSNPGIACALGFIPGLGAVYNGEYAKALIHIAVFGGIIAMLSADVSDATQAIFIVSLVVFYLYMPLDAYRVAKARRQGEAVSPLLGATGANRPMGAFVLIALGVLFLLSNFGLLRSEWIARGWPVALIAIGAWMLFRRVQGSP
jgi:hypothetical protein